MNGTFLNGRPPALRRLPPAPPRPLQLRSPQLFLRAAHFNTIAPMSDKDVFVILHNLSKVCVWVWVQEARAGQGALVAMVRTALRRCCAALQRSSQK